MVFGCDHYANNHHNHNSSARDVVYTRGDHADDICSPTKDANCVRDTNPCSSSHFCWPLHLHGSNNGYRDCCSAYNGHISGCHRRRSGCLCSHVLYEKGQTSQSIHSTIYADSLTDCRWQDEALPQMRTHYAVRSKALSKMRDQAILLRRTVEPEWRQRGKRKRGLRSALRGSPWRRSPLVCAG